MTSAASAQLLSTSGTFTLIGAVLPACSYAVVCEVPVKATGYELRTKVAEQLRVENLIFAHIQPENVTVIVIDGGEPLEPSRDSTSRLRQRWEGRAERMSIPSHREVAKYWPNPTSDCFHFWVLLDTSDQKRKATDNSFEPTARIKRPRIEADHSLAVGRQHGRESDATSIAARHNKLASEQKHRPVYNGRPDISLWGTPVSIFHKAFADFHDHVRERETIPPDVLEHAMRLAEVSEQFYDNEDQRTNAVTRTLAGLFGESSARAMFTEACPQGAIACPVNIRGESMVAYPCFMKVRVEVGEGGCDPCSQATFSYRKAVAEGEVHRYCCSPSFLLVFAGPWMAVFGAVITDQTFVEPLTPFINLGRYSAVAAPLVDPARVLWAIRRGISALIDFYKNLDTTITAAPSLLASPSQVYVPRLRSFTPVAGAEVHFRYLNRVMEDDYSRAIYEAADVNEPERHYLVKFTSRYGAEAHRCLADDSLRLAPRLLSVTPCGGGLTMVVMEFVNGKHATYHGEITDRACKDIRVAIQRLHKSGYVFGDLRWANIMLVERDGETRAQLIDFDWSGKHGEARYPSSLNPELPWHESAKPGGLIDHAHDNHMLSVLGVL